MNKYLITALLSTALTYTQIANSAPPLNLNGSSTSSNGATFIPHPIVSAYNDEVSVDTTKTLTATGNAALNDKVSINGVTQFISLSLLSNAAGNYGFLNFSSNGSFTYTLYDKSLEILKLSASSTLEEYFEYTIQGYPETKAVIHVHIAGNPNIFQTQDDEISIDSQTKSVTGNVASNDDTNGLTANNVSWSLNSSSSSQYGFLAFNSTGAYTYNLYTDATAVLALKAGEHIDDVFKYSIVGKDGRTFSGYLTVHINGNPEIIKAIDDEASVDTAVNTTVTGNVLDNDLNVLKGSAAISGLAKSNYGQLTFDSSGKFTYNLFSDAPAVLALKPGDVVSDTFTYTVKGTNGLGSASAKLTIRIAGNSSAASTVKAMEDTATLVIDTTSSNPSVDINIMDNDTNVGNVSLIGSPVGQYGFIVGGISKDGKLTYRVDLNNAAVQNALKSGSSVTDTFTYIATGKAPFQNLTKQANISIYIVAGTVGSFKAFDFIETILAEDGAKSVEGDLIAYNNTLLNSTDKTTRSELVSSQYGKYGYLQYSSSTNKFIYTLNNNVPEIQALRNTDNALQEVFKYRLIDRYGNTAEAKILINIVSRREQVSTDNVEIEVNNNSNLSTPLNSGNYMRGSLMDSSDRDWFFITSAGNESLHVEFCPQGFDCYNQGAWVVYIFDGSRLTQEMQNQTVSLALRRDDNGKTISPTSYDHMYLLYNYGIFKDALVGVIDPCYPGATKDGTRVGKTGVDIGIPTLAPGTTRNYFIAVSSPLQTTGSTTGGGSSQTSTCSGGSIILTKPGPTFKDADPADPTKSVDVKTTQEYIAVYPNSDDQYTFKVSRTGISPVNTQISTDAAVFDTSTGTAQVPKVRVLDNLFAVELQSGLQAKSTKDAATFRIKSFTPIAGTITPNPYMGVFNPVNNVVKLPKVIIDKTNQAYSVDLQYYPDNSLELKAAAPLSSSQ